MQQIRRDLISCTVGTVHYNLQSIKVDPPGDGGFDIFDIPASRVIQPEGLAYPVARWFFQWEALVLNKPLDLFFDIIRQLKSG